MQTSLFSFDLPDHLIARTPPENRGTSRLMLIERRGNLGEVRHENVQALSQLVRPGTLMVFNDSRVRRARIFAVNPRTGGRGEFLFLHPTPSGEWECLVDKTKKKRVGQEWIFPGDTRGWITGARAGGRRMVKLKPIPTEDWFEHHGHMPLPPYMHRPDGPEDSQRYQTVYAREVGSVAAPTAGLHFTAEILDALRKGGIQTAWVTLKVGLGTFSPVRTETVFDHTMHSEEYEVPKETAAAVKEAKREGRPVLAVGTTSMRALEAAWNGVELDAGHSQTDLFIYPGYKFNVVDSLFTNFHTPRSSLLILVSAFAGRERILEAYKRAVAEEYRFFSYGDAMLIR